MSASLQNQLVVAISSRALFDFEEENTVFDRDNDAAYRALQHQRLEVPASPRCGLFLGAQAAGL